MLRYRPSSAFRDWVVACFESRAEFLSRFPDRQACESWLVEQETEVEEVRDAIASETTRLMKEGFRYQDLEALRFEFPGPEES